MPDVAATDVELEVGVADEAIALVSSWLAASRQVSQDSSARRLAGVLRDPRGLQFTVDFVDGVIRPEDPHVAARNLRALAPLIPPFLPSPLRALLRTGALLGPVAPRLIVPATRLALRRMVRHLIVDAGDRRLRRAIRHIRGGGSGIRLNMNLLGEAILGEQEAEHRLEGTRRLLERDDVDYVSIKVSATVAPHGAWAFDDAVKHAVNALAPLFRIAASAPEGTKFINLDMEEYKDLDLTIAVFTALLDRDEFLTLRAGIVLQAYLPDAMDAMIGLQQWSRARRKRGGAPIKVRLVKGANLPMERVDAEIHGWPLATWSTKQASDASYKAVLDYALRPEHVDAVQIGVGGHNLFDVALARLLAQRRGVSSAVEFEMLLGMATAQAAVVREEVGSLLLYTPVVDPRGFDVAIAYLIRRLEEGASQENFMSAVFDLDTNPALFERERKRFLASVAAMPREVPKPNRRENRSVPQPRIPLDRFENTPDSDPAVRANREWVRAIQQRMPGSRLGEDIVTDNTIVEAFELHQRLESAVTAGESWRELGAETRAEILHRAGDFLQARRGDLLEVMGSECGKVIEQGDPEVSEAVDFAHYYAERGRELEQIQGARFSPSRLTVIAPPWNFPVAIPAGSTLAALASGSPAVLKPAAPACRTAAVMVSALWDAGVPREVLQYIHLDEDALGAALITHHAVEQVILTGAYETAQLFRRLRPDLPLLAETSGKNAIIVTPSADLDLAAKDVAYSAFGHAGQKCSAASLVILVGSVATSERFRSQLIDAVTSYHVGRPWEPASQIGPLIGPADGKLLHALTSLESGQRWMVKPERLSDDGSLWRPGIRAGVKPGSEFHLTEYFGPILGVMTAGTLNDAIEMVNRIDYGLTSGLQSLDEAEIGSWMDRVEAGNLYVNRSITGAIVQRQPFGGWKKSAVGTGAKAGGPNYLATLGRWSDAAFTRDANRQDALMHYVLNQASAAGVPTDAAEWLRRALTTDIDAWEQEFGVTRDITALDSEANVMRYRPLPVTVRIENASPAEVLRVLAAGLRVAATLTFSAVKPFPSPIRSAFADTGVEAQIEDEPRWHEHVIHLARQGGRIRLLGGTAGQLATVASGAPSLAVYDGEVVSAGRVEMLPFLREQAISITTHRFGTPHKYPSLIGVPRRLT